jgi:hypothetical protein
VSAPQSGSWGAWLSAPVSLQILCELNRNAQCLLTTFLQLGRGGGCGTHLPKEVVGIAILQKFDEMIDSSLPYM